MKKNIFNINTLILVDFVIINIYIRRINFEIDL